MPKIKTKKRVRLSTTIDEELLNKAKHLAIDLNRGLNDIIEEALKRLFDKLKKSA